MKKLIMATALISIATLSGCASSPLDYKTGTEVSATQLQAFVPGKTTQAQVITSIGQPNRKEAVGDKEVWYYDYNKVGAFGGNVSEATAFEWNNKSQLISAYKTGKSGKTGNALLDAANK